MKKRILATALCASMLLSSAVVGAADSTTDAGTGNNTGEGKVEGILDKEVFSVTLPTTGTKAYDFILDPQDLITATSNGAYTGAAFTGDTGMYFKTAENTYSEKSAVSTVTNKSSVDIDVTMDVKVDMDSMEGISIENAADLKETTPSINLALVGTKDSDPADTAYVGTDGTLSKTVKLDSDAADYTAEYETSAYVYKNTKTDHEDSKYAFYLTGAANKTATGWAEVKDKTPTITVTWSYAKHVENAAPSIATTSYTTSADTQLVIPVNLGAGSLGATAVSKVWDPTGAYDYIAGGYIEYSNSKITLSADTVNLLRNASVNGLIVEFDNGDKVNITLTHN